MSSLESATAPRKVVAVTYTIRSHSVYEPAIKDRLALDHYKTNTMHSFYVCPIHHLVVNSPRSSE
ncbi:hypothetical protein K0M31_005265 [Melipona bicolor]|uniref:Uncharacterized protein n=1 Tax=Melipona bicolor TaxID=60889 RepID=A0AA40KMK6_9HYME|nr:hypothetical protein K0M31_005265 [Melipona bicolor]